MYSLWRKTPNSYPLDICRNTFCYVLKLNISFVYYFSFFLQNDMTIDVEINIKSNEDTNTQKRAVNQLASKVSHITTDSSKEAQSLRTINLGKDTLKLQKIETVGIITAVCAKGQIYQSYIKDISWRDRTEIRETTCSKYILF